MKPDPMTATLTGDSGDAGDMVLDEGWEEASGRLAGGANGT
jgi:hypothetical protein